MADVPTTEPSSLRAGLSWSWKRSLPDNPAGTWTLKYWFKNATQNFELTASASGTDHLIDRTFTQTSAITPGSYSWLATAETASLRVEIGSGTMEVLPNVATTGVLEQRSVARQIVAALEAAFLDYAGKTLSGGSVVQSYTIGDRSMTFQTSAEIVQALNYWRVRVAHEDDAQSIAQGLGNPRRLFVRQ